MSVIKLIAAGFLLGLIGFAQSENASIPVNCTAGDSLQAAINAAAPNTTLDLKGVCTGPVVIATDGLKLRGASTASINGAKQDAVTINGARRIMIAGLTVTGGNNGIVAGNGAQILLQNTTVTGNALMGLQLESNSAATVTGGGISGNGVNGVDVESTSSLTVTGTYSITGNGVFGININGGSSLTLVQANLTVSSNTLGVAAWTGASGFIADSFSKLTVSNNVTTGLTVVSGSHMVDFGGAITCTGNGIHGISVDSKAGLDLDAASQVISSNNSGDGLHLEETSVVTIFNNPMFSGQPGNTTLTAQNNQANGINLETLSNLAVINFATLNVSGNHMAGIAVDDGSNVSFLQTTTVSGAQTTVTGNSPDVALSFGSRFTSLSNDTFGTATCDATVLVRGPFPVSCPAAKK